MSTILLIGASSAIATAFIQQCQQDDEIIAVSRDVNTIADHPAVIETIQANSTDFSAVNKLLEQLSKQYAIDSVILFSGNVMLKPVSLLTESDWNETIKINLNSAFNVAHAATKYLKKNFSLLFLSTSAAAVGIPNHEAIAAAKAGIEGLARSLAASYAKQGIRCNVVAPGLVSTPLTESILKNERGRELSLKMHSLGRFGQAEDIARCLHYLANPENNWITGETIRVDGGLTTTKLLT